LGKLDPLGERFVSFGEAVPKCEDVFRGDLINWTITEFPGIPLDVGPVGSHWIALKKLYPRKPCRPPMQSWRRPPLQRESTMRWFSRVVHFSFPFLVHFCIPGDTPSIICNIHPCVLER
jgi:hypothetical protein